MNSLNINATTFLNVLSLAAEGHKYQKRKAGKKSEQIPYINHPIQVSQLIANAVSVDSEFIRQSSGDWTQATILAALIHDVFEDTEIPVSEAAAIAGKKAVYIALEVTDQDDISNLDTSSRKAVQAQKAATYSIGATNLKIADQTSNLLSIVALKPNWTSEKIKAYRNGAELIVSSTPSEYRMPFLENEFRKASIEIDNYLEGLPNL